jgi:beta-lactam-binding protein with PASTA domain
VMPDFVGRPLGSVALAIKDAGFTLGKVTTAESPAPAAPNASGGSGQTMQPASIPAAVPLPTAANAAGPSLAAIVTSQQPAAGQWIVAGSEIRLVVR